MSIQDTAEHLIMLNAICQHAVILLAISLGGCASVRGPMAELSGKCIAAPKVEMVYRVERRPSDAHSDRTAASGGRASTLFISAPHASCKPGFARVELIEHASSDSAESSSDSTSARQLANAMEGILPGIRLGEGIDAAWSFDVRESEIRNIITQLESTGFFQEPSREFDERVVLVVRRDSAATSRRWQSMEALDRLRSRAKKEGRLVGYTGPAVSAASLLPEPAASPKMVRLPVVGAVQAASAVVHQQTSIASPSNGRPQP
jgi:hypothetical protein